MSDLVVRSFLDPPEEGAPAALAAEEPYETEEDRRPASESKSPGPKSSSERSESESKYGSHKKRRRVDPRHAPKKTDEHPSASSSSEPVRERSRKRPRKTVSASPAREASSSSPPTSPVHEKQPERAPAKDAEAGAAAREDGPFMFEDAIRHLHSGNRRLHALNGRPVAAAAGAGGDEKGAGGGGGGDVSEGLASNPPTKFIPLLHEAELETEQDMKLALANNGPGNIDWCFLCNWTQKVSDDVQVNTDFVDRIEKLGFEFYGTLRDLEWAKNIQSEFNRIFRNSMPVNEHNRKPWWTLCSIRDHFTKHVQNTEVVLQKQKRVYAELIEHAQRTMVLFEDEQNQKQLNPNGAKLLLALMDKQQKLLSVKK